MIQFKNAQNRCYVSFPESEVVKIANMELGFYMCQKLLNVHVPKLAHLAKRVRQKGNVSYVEMGSSSEESVVEFSEVDLVELNKNPPCVCSLLKKIVNVEKFTDLKYTSGKKRQDIAFDKRFEKKALFHSTNNCVCCKDLTQEAIIEGILKFDDGKKDMKVDTDPIGAGANFVETHFMGSIWVALPPMRDFETNVRAVYPGVGEGLLEFLMQQKLKDRDVSFCPRCNVRTNLSKASFSETRRSKFSKFSRKLSSFAESLTSLGIEMCNIGVNLNETIKALIEVVTLIIQEMLEEIKVEDLHVKSCQEDHRLQQTNGQLPLFLPGESVVIIWDEVKEKDDGLDVEYFDKGDEDMNFKCTIRN
ncbi:hypothetical protein Ahy_A04g019942 [Arachis hypogaea]|uniref:Uncharacterized protein n=1 Tax=Arachis hypogaea TaxID=3818 RepID=A0A445DGU3_ARAHY|nr:hypothetical protein Ahy_A04g019942 [Arachis hypogaea]